MSCGPTDDDALDELLAKIATERPRVGECVDDGVLVAHREGRTSAEERDAVELHVASCAECRSLLAELEEVPASTEAWARGTLGRRRWPKIGAVAAVVAIAAGLALAWLAIPEEEMPEYELSGPYGSVRSTRGDAVESGVFVPSSSFKLLLRPAARVQGPVSMIVLVKSIDGRLHVAPDSGRSEGEGGAFRYEIRAEQLFGAEYGLRTVHVIIARGGGERRFTLQVEYRASADEAGEDEE